MNFLKLRYTFLITILVQAALYGQNPEDSLAIDKTITLGEVVINSDLFGKDLLNYPGAVSHVQKQNFEQANNLYLQPVLNSIPGVYMHSGALNTNRITIRGIGSRTPFSTNKIKAYLDEIPLSTGEGDTTLEDIDFSTIGGIEVYRGPVSTIYGAGLGGAVHMLTPFSFDNNNLSMDFSIGSFGLQKTNLKANVGNERSGVGIYYQKVDSDGYRDNNQYDRQSITAISKTTLSEKTRLTGYLNVSSLKAFIPSSLDLEDFTNNPTEAATPWANAMGFEDNDRVRLGLSLRSIFNDRSEATMALFGNFTDSREVTPFGNEEIQSSNFGLRGKFRHELIPEKFTLVVGTEIFLENFGISSFENDNSNNGALTADLDQDRNYLNLFVATDYKTSNDWVFSFGGNLNFSSYKNNDNFNSGAASLSGNSSFDPLFSPKVSVTKMINANSSIYTQLAHGFSLPTFDETLNPNGEINEDIRPETGLSYEIGYKSTFAENKLYVEVVAYMMKISDLLVARRNTELDFSGFNAGSSTHNGLEILLDHQILKKDFWNVKQRLSVSIMDYQFDEFIDDDRGDFSGNELTGVPGHNINYQLNFNTKIGLYGNIVWQSTEEIPILDDNSIFSESYSLANLKLGYQKKFGSIGLNVYGGINNLFDEKYASMLQINPRFNQRYYYPGLPINFYSGIQLTYQFK